MASPIRNTALPTLTDGFAPMVDWPRAVIENLWRLQRFQLEALATWQQTMAGFQQELWDEWVAHWGGGVPIEP